MAKVIVVTSGKGGVGKTTVTANLGCTLAKFGDKVCVIDADIGLKNLDVVLGLENRVVHTLIDVVNGKVSAQEALVKHKQQRNLYLLATSQVATKEMVSPEDMKAVVKALHPLFDYIIIDSPAGIERGFRNAVAPAELALIVTTPELPALSDADRVVGLLENLGFDEKSMKVILNRFKSKMVKAGEMLTEQDVATTLALEIIGVVPDCEDVIIATNKGIPVVLNGDLNVTKVFENIARRLKGETIPLDQDLSQAQERGFLSFFKNLFGKKRS